MVSLVTAAIAGNNPSRVFGSSIGRFAGVDRILSSVGRTQWPSRLSVSRGSVRNGLEWCVRGCFPSRRLVPAGPRLADWSEVKLEVRRVLRRFFNKTIERRPVILPLILEM